MKSAISLLLITLMALSLAACGEKVGSNNESGLSSIEPAGSEGSEASNKDSVEVSAEKSLEETSEDYIYLLSKVEATGNLLYSSESLDWGYGPGNGTCAYDGRGNIIEKVWTGSSDTWGEEAEAGVDHVITWTYDDNNRMTSEISVVKGLGDTRTNIKKWKYDAFGNVIEEESDRDKTIGGQTIIIQYDYTYDSDNRVLTQMSNSGYGKRYAYNEKGYVVSDIEIKNANGFESIISDTETTYDEEDRVIQVVKTGHGETRTNTYVYNESGYLISNTLNVNSIEEKTTYEYNERGQLISETFLSYRGEEEKTEYEYDDVGNKVSVISPKGLDYYEWDDYGNMTSEKHADEHGVIKKTILYSYYQNNILKQKQIIQDSSSESSEHVTYTYDYDANGNLVKYTVERKDAKDPKYRLYELVLEYEKIKAE